MLAGSATTGNDRCTCTAPGLHDVEPHEHASCAMCFPHSPTAELPACFLPPPPDGCGLSATPYSLSPPLQLLRTQASLIARASPTAALPPVVPFSGPATHTNNNKIKDVSWCCCKWGFYYQRTHSLTTLKINVVL